MGLFGKKKQKETDTSVYQWMTVEEALAYSKGEKVVPQAAIINALDENRIQKRNIERQQSETKAELASVTSYLSDIQKINLLEGEAKREVLGYAQSIVELKAERENFIKNDRTLSPQQYNTMELYEAFVPEQLKRMEENERYMTLVNNDIRHLEGEKGSIKTEISDLEKKQSDLRRFLIGMSVFTIVVFIALFSVAKITKVNLVVPFFITGVVALLTAFYVLFSMRKTTEALLRDELKLNKVITLLNKVKIKYVNTSSVLEYSYDKFDVNSCHELMSRWQQYQKERQLEERHKRNAQMLSTDQSSLTRALQRMGVSDPIIWAHQPEPLLDPSALADLTLRLNDRRQKLRAAMEFANRQLDMCNDEIEALIAKHPTQERVLRELMKEGK